MLLFCFGVYPKIRRIVPSFPSAGSPGQFIAILKPLALLSRSGSQRSHEAEQFRVRRRIRLGTTAFSAYPRVVGQENLEIQWIVVIVMWRHELWPRDRCRRLTVVDARGGARRALKRTILPTTSRSGFEGSSPGPQERTDLKGKCRTPVRARHRGQHRCVAASWHGPEKS